MIKKITAILPMKRHSERVPNKNLKRFGGTPLYHRIALALEKSEYIQEILINTDSEAIALDAAKHFPKVRIIKRPLHLQGDMVPMNDIIGYDISQCTGEHFLQTHSTNPLITTATINQAIERYFMQLHAFDSLFSVTRLQTRLYDAKGRAINHNPAELLRTQDLPPVFEENSCFYLFSKSGFKQAGNKRIGLKSAMFEMDKLEAIDIDEPEDFVLAEALYTLRQSRLKA